MSFFKLLYKKFFPNAYQAHQKKQAAKAQQRQEASFKAAADNQEPPSESAQQSSYKRRRTTNSHAFEVNQPAWLGRLGRFLPSPQHPLRRFWRRYHIGKLLLIGMGLFVLVFGSYLFYLAKTAKVSDLQSALKATTLIYDKKEAYAGRLTGQKGSYVELDAVSERLQDAVIATEDRTFYTNNGINIKRFLLAVVTAGHFGGGSTITQQLAKNAYLSQDQTIKRKAREFFLALELSKKYSKKDILTMYLNNAYFGHGVWGVEDASQKYFGTSARDLTLDEAATLAGMLKGPEIYNPYYSVANATNRRNTVLAAMVDAKKISKADAAAAERVGMGERLADNYTKKTNDYKYPSYFDAVINEAIRTYGISEKDLVNNGYKIYTELDQHYQAGMQTTFNTTSLFPVSEYDNSQAQGASVALDPKTGGVRGLVGRVNSTENPTFRSFNYATQAKRSPASTIKPLVVYAPAIAAGWSIDKTLPNTLRDFKGYKPHNYGNYESEDVPMYQALANSYNIPAVATLDALGVDKAISYGKKFGLNMAAAHKELGLALGGSVTTNPLEMAQAYSAFANKGVMHSAHFITRIETANGHVLKEHQDQTKRVISQSVADKMTSMMLGTFSNGSAVNANVYGYTMAGKTGTTETDFNPDLAGDQWVIGYTPDVVISQWVGFNKTDQHHYLTDSSAGTASAIFSTQASYILPYTKGTPFKVENAYAQNGISAIYGVNETATDTASKSQEIINGLRKSAEEASRSLSDAVDRAGLREKAQNLWNGIVDFIR
ncbi:penicillin-binding protein PBP2A [Streptococcus halichoeri]|uniref:penicillin-binding protein PBP2A n=1 Tax=Streptococcus halichoeri TaxID=254785 RepID=UPI00135896B6|nr:penicillin-binding protein PBP2A [Streptococcus halichoeri]